MSSKGGITLEVCPLFKDPCRHCSHEHTWRPCTKLKKDIRTGRLVPDGLGRVEIDLGYYCNDAGRFVENMQWCPIKWDKANWNKMIKEYLEKEKKAPKKRGVKKVVDVVKKPAKKKVVTKRKPVTKKVVKKRKP